MQRMIVCTLLSVKLCIDNIFLYMPEFPALQATPLLTTAVVADLEPDSVRGRVRIFDELLHGCLSWPRNDYRTFRESRVAVSGKNFRLAGMNRSGFPNGRNSLPSSGTESPRVRSEE